MKQCKDCAHYAYSNGVLAYCQMHSIIVKKGSEPCEKFRLKEQPKEEVGRP